MHECVRGERKEKEEKRRCLILSLHLSDPRAHPYLGQPLHISKQLRALEHFRGRPTSSITKTVQKKSFAGTALVLVTLHREYKFIHTNRGAVRVYTYRMYQSLGNIRAAARDTWGLNHTFTHTHIHTHTHQRAGNEQEYWSHRYHANGMRCVGRYW